MHTAHFSWAWALLVCQECDVSVNRAACALSNQIVAGEEVGIELLLGSEPDSATTSGACLTLGKAFTNMAIHVFIENVLLASGTLEFHLVELLLLEPVER